MKFNYAAHAGPEAACVNPLHACRISNTHLNPFHHHPHQRPRARDGQTVYPQRERTRCMWQKSRAHYHKENTTITENAFTTDLPGVSAMMIYDTSIC